MLRFLDLTYITPWRDLKLLYAENFSLTNVAPSPFPSPRRGEGGGEGKFQIYLVRIFDLVHLPITPYFI